MKILNKKKKKIETKRSNLFSKLIGKFANPFIYKELKKMRSKPISSLPKNRSKESLVIARRFDFNYFFQTSNCLLLVEWFVYMFCLVSPNCIFLLSFHILHSPFMQFHVDSSFHVDTSINYTKRYTIHQEHVFSQTIA